MLILYVLTGCPYCVHVQRAFADIHVTYDERNVADVVHRQALVTHGGKSQVPYLIDEEHGVAMYESQDIIKYVRGLCDASLASPTP